MHFQGNVFQDLKEKKVLDKDGKVDALGPYGKSKLTGMEVNAYFKKNKVSDPKVKKAVEVALDLGGSHSVATKEIAKFYGSKILKSKEVQKALKFANESFVLNQELNQIHESYLTEKNLMPAIQKIVSDKQAQKVGGVMLDMFTASMISKVYDKVNDSNKAKMEKANINVLVKLAHKVMGMKEDLDEGKYAKYSDLLIKKAKLMKAGKDASMVDKEISKELKKLGIKEEVIVEKIVGTGDAISKIFKTKDKKEIDGIANLMNMTSLKVLQSMQKQNPKGFKRMTAKMGELPAMEEIEEGGKSAAQQAAIAISKKEKAGKPGYDKEGKSLKKESVMDAYRSMHEAKDLDPATIGKIAAMTDNNDHNKALMTLASAMKEKKAEKMLKLLSQMHKEMGHMTSDMMGMRKGIYDELMKKSKKMYKNHKEINGAF